MINQLKTVLLLGTLSAILVGLGAALAPGHMHLFLVLAVIMNLGAYLFSDRIVLAIHGARELGYEARPSLHRMVDELAGAAGIPKPRIFLVPDDRANAFATGRGPKRGVVAVTEGLLQVLDPRELRGVLAHEIAHIKNRDVLVATIAATLAAAATYAAHALSLSALFGRGHDEDDDGASSSGGLLFALAAPFAASLVQLGISRSREYFADETAARLTSDPEGLALALERLDADAREAAGVSNEQAEPATASLFIVNPFASAGWLLSLFSTHPPIAERARRLRSLAPTLDPQRRATAYRGRVRADG